MPFWRKSPAAPDPKALLREGRALLVDGALDEAIERFDTYVQVHPDDDAAWAELARALVKAQRIDEAVDIVADLNPALPSVFLAKGEALAAHGDFVPALEALATARDGYKHEIQTNFHSEYARDGMLEASQLFDMVYAELHGHEQVVVEHATRGRLDARAGANYKLLGNSLMVASEHTPDVLDLESVDEMTERLHDMPTHERRGVPGLLLNGTIALREGRAADAVTVFQRLMELDGRHFAGFHGLGAAMHAANHGSVRRADRLVLPDPHAWQGLDDVVVDLPNLTPIERKIVLCSIEPFRRALPPLATAGAKIQIMPLDARTTDYPAFAGREDSKANEDPRALRALSGVATSRFALVRIDELFDLQGDHGWVYAHEFVHLAHHCLAVGARARIAELYEQAKHAGYVSSAYAQKNEFEFLAEHYTAYLMERHELKHTRATDDLGIAGGMRALLDDIDSGRVAFVHPA